MASEAGTHMDARMPTMLNAKIGPKLIKIQGGSQCSTGAILTTAAILFTAADQITPKHTAHLELAETGGSLPRKTQDSRKGNNGTKATAWPSRGDQRIRHPHRRVRASIRAKLARSTHDATKYPEPAEGLPEREGRGARTGTQLHAARSRRSTVCAHRRTTVFHVEVKDRQFPLSALSLW